MAEKRKVSGRGRPAETTSKKRQRSPEVTSSPDPPEEEGLPTKIESGAPLPTVVEPQPSDLSPKEYQSIAESGVLAASLQRSRQRWLSEGFFERYWTRPSRGKNKVAESNPPKESMSRLGHCTMTIEPHVFEITLFTVREPSVQPSSSASSSTKGAHRPILQYGPPKNSYHHPSPPVLNQYHAPPSHTPTYPPAPTPFQSQPAPPMAANSHRGSPYQHQTPYGATAPTSSGTGQHPPVAGAPTPKDTSRPSPAPSTKQSPDPVIQMLAAKAATDNDLKELMKVVAGGTATGPELRVFQKHIDELTAILQSEKAANRPKGPPPPARKDFPPHSTINGSSPAYVSHESSQPPPRNNGPYPQWSSTTQMSAAPLHPQYPGQHLSPSVPPPPPTKMKGANKGEAKAIIFEFSTSGDRFLLPKYSILDYHRSGLEVIASFLVVRKGSSSETGQYDPALDYYQPVTMRLAASDAKTLIPFSKVVASPDEVRRYMDDVMDNMTRAEYVHLAMQLPRDPDDGKDPARDGSSDNDDRNRELKEIYAPPGSIGPPKRRVPKQMSFPVDSLDRSSAEPWNSPGPKSDAKPAKKRGRIANTNKRCRLCQTTETSLWRKADIDGDSVTVCNACGIKWKASTGRGAEGAPKRQRGTPKLNKTPSQQTPPPHSFTPIQHTNAAPIDPSNNNISRDDTTKDA
ncbi:MAG: hypothetical protein M4579_006785 [Chaenotheca gracillima]|nr:MAG: hypothetical protein M4579_006785 [Chaenotheca gracillima]